VAVPTTQPGPGGSGQLGTSPTMYVIIGHYPVHKGPGYSPRLGIGPAAATRLLRVIRYITKTGDDVRRTRARPATPQPRCRSPADEFLSSPRGESPNTRAGPLRACRRIGTRTPASGRMRSCAAAATHRLASIACRQWRDRDVAPSDHPALGTGFRTKMLLLSVHRVRAHAGRPLV
jgi:hypothetical protein